MVRSTTINNSANKAGGFGSLPKYDTHILNTLYAVQVLFMEDALDRIDVDKVAACKSKCRF